MFPPPTTMPTSTPRRVDLGDLARDERAERRVDAVLAIAQQRLAGQLEQDPVVAEAAVRRARGPPSPSATVVGHSSSPSS